MGHAPQDWELKQRRDSQIWGNPLCNREIDWDRRETFEAVGSEVANLWQMGQSKKYTDGPYHDPTCPGL